MCLLAVLFRVHPASPLVVAANRDEMLDRPATPMTVLRDAPRTIGGRDERAGGTWLAVNEHGVVAGLTNQPAGTVGQRPDRRSRGELPLALTSATSADEGVARFAAAFRPPDFNGAWLLVGDRSSLWAVDMTGDEVATVRLDHGIHVLENRPVGRPSPKVDHVRSALRGVEHVPAAELTARLAAVLADHTIPAAARVEPELSTRPPQVAAACVHAGAYGTRWSAVVLVPPGRAARPEVHHADGPPCTTAFAVSRWLA